MMLTTDQIEKITVDMLTGANARVKGEEADDFRARLQKDIATAEENGWAIEIPFEIADISETGKKQIKVTSKKSR